MDTPARYQLVALTIGAIRRQRFEQVEFWWSKRWNLTGRKKLPNEALEHGFSMLDDEENDWGLECSPPKDRELYPLTR